MVIEELLKIIEILICPECHSDVKYIEKDNKIHCPNCKKKYDIIENIPILLTNSAIEQLNFKPDYDLKKRETRAFLRKFLNFSRKLFGCWFIADNTVYKKLDNLISKDENKLILEIGSGETRMSKKAINIEIEMNLNVDLVTDAHNLPFKNESIDVISSNFVLEHVKSPQKVVEEMFRVLKHNGVIFAAMPLIMPFHSYPSDYFRFTTEGIKEIFSRFENKEVGILMGPGVSLLNILSEYFTLFTFSKNKYLYVIIKGLVLLLTFPIKFLDIFLVKNPESHKIGANLYILANKP